MPSTKRQRQRNRKATGRSTSAEIEVVCPGMLEVLSVGKGDIKLVVGGDNPDDIDKGRAIIEEMLRKGYGIFVETEEGLTRVKRFNPKRMTYVISELVPQLPAAPETPALPAGPGRKTAGPGRGRKVKEKEVPVAGSKAKAIGRTAGG